jgi:hypothetical protein
MILRPLSDPKEDAARELGQRLIKAERMLADETTRRRAAESDLEDALREKRSLQEGVQRLRTSLTPLYDSLRLLFGDMELMGVEDASGAPASPQKVASSPAWESWKARLGGVSAKMIDILMLHGELTQEQIRIHIGTNRMQTIYDATKKLNKAGIINKRDGRISLKPL